MRRQSQPNPPKAKWQGLHGHWPNMKGQLPSMAWIVVVLLGQCDDQVKIGLPWMEIHFLLIVTN
jgi:hypothetical protein